MLTARSIQRPALLSALACAVLVFAMSGAATAQPGKDKQTSAALAQERYYSSYGAPDANHTGTSAEPDKDTQTSAALAQERYYSSYGEPEPLTLPRPSAPSDETPWLPIALSMALALAVVAASATQLRRLRVRRRAARATT